MDDKQLNELLDLTRENNKILRKMQSSNRWASFFSFLYYVLIISSIVGSYYLIQPMLQPILDAYQNMAKDIQGVKGGLQNVNSNLNLPPDTLDQLKKALNIQ